MKKLLSIVLAVMMIASASIATVSAEILYSDTFDSWNWDFWGGVGDFDVVNGVLEGFHSAMVCQAIYTADPSNSELYADGPGTFKEHTEWVEVYIAPDDDAEEYWAGIWFDDKTRVASGFTDDRDMYWVAYWVNADETISQARLWRSSPMDRERGGKWPEIHDGYTYDVPGNPGFNIDLATGDHLETVKIGAYWGQGYIKAYCNGVCFAEFTERNATIGQSNTPFLFWQNMKCLVHFDNLFIGDLDEDVAARTALDVAPATYALTLDNATAEGAEDLTAIEAETEITVTADEAEEGYVFDKWSVVADTFTLEDETANPITFAMPAENVSLTATYKEIEKYAITVENGTADKAEAAEGETVTITAAAAEEGKEFDAWTGEGVEFADASAAETTFVMPAAAVTVTATYKDAGGDQPPVEEPEFAITVEGGSASVEKAKAGATVTITAAAPAEGKVFSTWSGSVEFADAKAATTSFVMPEADVTVTAVYEDIAEGEYAITVENGTASVNSSKAGETITITAAEIEGKEFVAWEAEGIELADATAKETTFTMPEAAVTVKATYKDVEVVPPVSGKAGDVNDDGKVNVRDIAMMMRAQAGWVQEGYNENNQDYNADGKFNARDIAQLMRDIAAGKVE